MTSKLHLGLEIEKKAAVHLIEQGWRLLDSNFRKKYGEIDLVFEQELPGPPGGIELVFVEVRMRTTGSAWQTGFESVGPQKRRRLETVIQCYLQKYQGCATAIRMDVLWWDGAQWEHMPDAW